MQKQDQIHQLTAHLFREDSGKMVAFLSARYGINQLDSVMDIVQDTFEAALSKWRFSGIPDNPSAWLMQVAKNKAINALKHDATTTGISSELYLAHAENELPVDFSLSEQEITDSQLRLLLLCCHPEFSSKNQIIITLHILCGFGVPEIANALLMKDEAVKKALLRCKSFLRKSGDLMTNEYLFQANQQTQTVQTIIYLIFNEGYKTTRSMEAINHDLCYEAIRLAKLLTNSRSAGQHQTEALLALMFFNLSRFTARINTSGEWLTLEEQDRSKWNKVFIEEGYYYLNLATQSDQLSRFHLEAIIASIHCAASSFEETNWQQIVALYRQLEQLTPKSPFITLNKIIAESYVSTAIESLQSLDKIAGDSQLKNNFLVPATRGDIYQREHAFQEAITAYTQAMKLAVSAKDKVLLQKKITQCQLKSRKT
ncbi:MAG: sigma-70 family RNA polymerase sigma factor [Fluviicola sp.]|nr:sigma-70 family RNA polymerase sigma factor [Fluviicola sp.]